MNVTADPLKIYILCRYAHESSLYNSWISDLVNPVVIVEQCSTDFVPPLDCGIVITHEHYRWEEFAALRRIYEQRQIPILMLADGILEYRNTWKNPKIPDGSIYQPLMADKIACIGANSARMIESWGNPGKTEVIGLPRLDQYLAREWEVQGNSEFRLLVATANTPYFDEQQLDVVLRSLISLKETLSTFQLESRTIHVDWRLTAGLDEKIGVENQDEPEALLDAIAKSDAVITTPSTIFIESALLRKPTAILDFSNSPQFTNSAWLVSAEEHIGTTLNELSNPPAAKTLFQDFVLFDNLRCESEAKPRMVELVSRMIELGAEFRSKGEPIQFPANIIPPDEPSRASNLELSKMFAGNESFDLQELDRIRAELSQARHRLGTLPQELNDKNTQITQLQAALDESRKRVADVRARLFKLRKILGIGKENQTE